MKPTTGAKRTNALDDEDLRQFSDLSFSSVIADIANSEQRAPKEPKRRQREIDLESTHTDRTINELLAGTFSASEPSSAAEPRPSSVKTVEPEAAEATGDLIDPDLLFPELHLKE